MIQKFEEILGKIEEFDSGMRFLIRVNIIISTTLLVAIVTYYQIIDAWNLTHESGLLYGFTLGITVSIALILSLRTWRIRYVSRKKSV